MDFPNVHLVVQVGLPFDGQQYVHRVGRTARAGKKGRAVILLTQREKFFLNDVKHLPITPYPEDITSATASSSSAVDTALQRVDEALKANAYTAWLGFHLRFANPKQMQLDKAGLVLEGNAYSAMLGLPEPPKIESKNVGKMGLKGVPGLSIGPKEIRAKIPPP